MKIKTIIVVLGMLLPVLSVHAQDIKPLSIGDTVPNLVLHNVINYKDSVIRLSDFKDKLVILDFMNTGCSSCIAALPPMDSLSKASHGKVHFFLSIPEHANRARAFIQTNPIGKKVLFPVVTADQPLEAYFPHVYISHIVWIYRGTVVAITHSDYVTATHIKEILSGSPVAHWPVKRDVTGYKKGTSILAVNAEAIPEFSFPSHLWYWAFSSHLDNIPAHYSLQYEPKVHETRLTIINRSLFQMFLYAYGLPLDFDLSRTGVTEISELYIHNTGKQLATTDWKAGYTYCIEARMEGRLDSMEVREKLRHALQRQFGIAANYKDTLLTCWQLSEKAPDLLQSFLHYSDDAAARKAGVMSLWQLVNEMNHTMRHVPVQIPKDYGLSYYFKRPAIPLDDLHALNSFLAPYGLEFKERTEKMGVLQLHYDKTFKD